MIWIDNITDLQYYNQPQGVPCYCEYLIFPSDMILQGYFPKTTGTFTGTFYVYSADGLTQYEDATSKFDIYYASDPVSGRYLFNARLKEWADSMCTYKCFIVRAVITVLLNDGSTITVFDKYTERYCQSECCDQARDIEILQASLVDNGGTLPAASNNSKPYTECDRPVLRLISNYDCYDPFSDIFYGIPDVIIQGDAGFAFTKISTFRGKLVRRPREIKRELSYNCRLQRASSAAQWLLQGYEYFPPWKMYEIEGQLHAKEIYVDDYTNYKQFQFAGGTAFSLIHSCIEMFKLNVELQECEIRKIYGCDTPCGTPSLYDGYQSFFVIPEDYQGGNFYDYNQVLVATDLDELIEYIRNLNGITEADYIYSSPTDCSVYAVIGFSGNSTLPNSIYYDNTSASNRIFAVGIEEIEDICDFVPTVCSAPEFSIVVADSDCSAPEFSVSLEYTAPVEFDIYAVDGFTLNAAQSVGLYNNNQTSFDIRVTSTNYIPTGAVDELIELVNEPIGIIPAVARPTSTVYLTEDTAPLPTGSLLSIDTNGIIRYSGEPTTYNTGVSIEILLTDIVYNTNNTA